MKKSGPMSTKANIHKNTMSPPIESLLETKFLIIVLPGDCICSSLKISTSFSSMPFLGMNSLASKEARFFLLLSDMFSSLLFCYSYTWINYTITKVNNKVTNQRYHNIEHLNTHRKIVIKTVKCLKVDTSHTVKCEYRLSNNGA